MQKYTDVVTSARSGAAIPNARVTVKTYPGDVAATIYSDDGITEQDNPITTDARGQFSFYAADGRYSLVVSGTGITEQTLTDHVLLADPDDADPEQSAADVSFAQSGTGATPRSAEEKLQDIVNAADFGASPSATAAVNSAAILAALAAHTEVELNAGEFEISSSIVVPDGKVLRGRGHLTNGTILKTTAAITALSIGNSSNAEGIRLDGDGTGLWGLLLRWGSTASARNMRVTGFVDAGVVYDSHQNGLFENIRSDLNGINWAFYRDPQNNTHTNCTGDLGSSVDATGSRNILFSGSEVDARLTAAPLSTGPNDNRFYGGIFERGTLNDYNVEVKGIGGVNTFYSTHFNKGATAIIHMNCTTAGAKLILQNPTLSTPPSGKNALKVTAGEIVTVGRVRGSGFSVPVPGWDVKTGGVALTEIVDEYNMQGATPTGVQTTGGATNAWNSTKRRWEITSTGPTSAGWVYLSGSSVITAVTRDYGYVEVEVIIDTINGDAAGVRCLQILTGSPFRRQIGATVGPGRHTFFAPMDPLFAGIGFSAETTTSTTFEVAYLRIKGYGLQP